MEMDWLEISNIIHLPNEGSNWGSAYVTKTTSSHPEFHLPSSSTSLKLPRVSVCLSLIKISTQKSSLRWRQTGRNWGCMGLGPVNEILMSNKPSLTESYVHGRKNSKCLITPQFLPLWIHPRVVFVVGGLTCVHCSSDCALRFLQHASQGRR